MRTRCHAGRRLVAASAFTCYAILLVGTALAAPPPHTAAAPQCSAANTAVWLGLGLGGGTAGTIYYPLEFSNVSHGACTLHGYPGVSAYSSSVKQIGLSARRNGAHSPTVTLKPDATAHAILGIREAGALCSRSVNAVGLNVYPPGQRVAQEIPFSLKICPKTSVLVVGPLRAGVGIPGYTTR